LPFKTKVPSRRNVYKRHNKSKIVALFRKSVKVIIYKIWLLNVSSFKEIFIQLQKIFFYL